MGKIEKRRSKLSDRILYLEKEMRSNLSQKVSNTKEISVSWYLTEIDKLRKQLLDLK